MFHSLFRPAARAARHTRLYSPQVALAPADLTTAPAHAATTASPPLPYFVRRNTKGSIPVYTDIRNGGTRYQVLIRNVEGNADALADDLARTLFPKGSNEAKRLAVQANNNRHLILTGGRWKNDVVRWLVQRGF